MVKVPHALGLFQLEQQEQSSKFGALVTEQTLDVVAVVHHLVNRVVIQKW
jgi:hypothetical protein